MQKTEPIGTEPVVLFKDSKIKAQAKSAEQVDLEFHGRRPAIVGRKIRKWLAAEEDCCGDPTFRVKVRDEQCTVASLEVALQMVKDMQKSPDEEISITISCGKHD